MKFAHAEFVITSAFMNAAGVVAYAPCERTAPVAEVHANSAAAVPVANAIVDGLPVIPEVTSKLEEIES
jgi:hypothetical protein